ncbi:MAG: OsmC family protein [Anaerolineales bacterium]|nr:OsmC family protein [Anaerolineales bacterium]
MDKVKGTVNLKWTGGRMMLGADSRGVTLPIGSNDAYEPGWKGLKPSDLLLLAAASCSAYDVVSVLEKQRVDLQGLEVACSGEQLSEPPYTFVSIHLHYQVRGAVPADKLERAIQLSEDKYCSVLATLRPGTDLSSSYEILSDNGGDGS